MKSRPLLTALSVIIVLIVTASVLSPTLAVDDRQWPDQFDHHFRKQAKRYFGVGFDWRWFRAQGIVESGLRADAISPRGALGIMQILPTTYEEIQQDSLLRPGIEEPRWNIAAGISYLRYLYERWSDRVEDDEVMSFALASYNAGFRRINNANDAAGAGNIWQKTAVHVNAESRNYVRKINALMQPPSH